LFTSQSFGVKSSLIADCRVRSLTVAVFISSKVLVIHTSFLSPYMTKYLTVLMCYRSLLNTAIKTANGSMVLTQTGLQRNFEQKDLDRWLPTSEDKGLHFLTRILGPPHRPDPATTTPRHLSPRSPRKHGSSSTSSRRSSRSLPPLPWPPTPGSSIQLRHSRCRPNYFPRASRASTPGPGINSWPHKVHIGFRLG
jgi:hypothetical protein